MFYFSLSHNGSAGEISPGTTWCLRCKESKLFLSCCCIVASFLPFPHGPRRLPGFQPCCYPLSSQHEGSNREEEGWSGGEYLISMFARKWHVLCPLAFYWWKHTHMPTPSTRRFKDVVLFPEKVRQLNIRAWLSRKWEEWISGDT